MPPSHSRYSPAPVADVLHLVDVVRAIVPTAAMDITIQGDQAWLTIAAFPVPDGSSEPVAIMASRYEWLITIGEATLTTGTPDWLAPESPISLKDVLQAVLRFLDRRRCPQ